MTDATTTEVPDTLTGEQAIATVRADPASVLLKPEIWSRFFTAIKKTLDDEACDLSTEKGRKAVASKAYKVTQTKTAIEKGGIALSKAITARRNDYVDQLEKLAVETRAPLTVWEEAETSRKAKCKDIIDRIQRMAKIEWNDTSDGVINRLCEVEMIELDALTFGDDLAQAQETQRQAVETMNAAIERLEGEERDKAELKRLQDAEAERQRLADLQAENDAEAERQRVAALAQLEPEVEEAAAPPPATSEASIAAAQMGEPDDALDDGMPIIAGKPFVTPSSARQSTVSEASKIDLARLDAVDAMLASFDKGPIEDCIYTLIDAIIAGDIPHVTFSAE